MNVDEAADRLEEARRVRQLSARSGAWASAGIVSAGVLAMGVTADLDLWWITGLVVLGLAGIWAARPLRSRFDWSNRSGAFLVIGGGILALAVYIAVQFPVRAAGWPVPNTIGATAAIVVVLVLCRAGLERMANAAAVSPPAPGGRR